MVGLLRRRLGTNDVEGFVAYIKEHPYLALIAALAVGTLLAKFFVGGGGLDDIYLH
jgi:hypothetical protein